MGRFQPCVRVTGHGRHAPIDGDLEFLNQRQLIEANRDRVLPANSGRPDTTSKFPKSGRAPVGLIQSTSLLGRECSGLSLMELFLLPALNSPFATIEANNPIMFGAEIR